MVVAVLGVIVLVPFLMMAPRNPNYSAGLAEACASACEECERHDAEHCQVCTDVLQECAESCRDMMAA